MKCWCENVASYTCGDCEKKAPWNRLSRHEKIDLLAYVKKLKRGEDDFELTKRILNKNLCVSMIPKNANI